VLPGGETVNKAACVLMGLYFIQYKTDYNAVIQYSIANYVTQLANSNREDFVELT